MRSLPPHDAALLKQAKEAYLDGNYGQARKLNQDAARSGDPATQVLGLRWQGVCLYRLDDFEGSRRMLEDARDLAAQHGCRRQELLIANHLGASFKRLGLLEEALGVFQVALGRARGPDMRVPRGRLLGNLGALWDELQMVDRAQDCYARYEILCELEPGLASRLPNARGLAGRACRQRGDWDGAHWRFHDELRLGQERGDRLRIFSATRHLAYLALDQERNAEALRLCRWALRIPGIPDARRQYALRLELEAHLALHDVASAWQVAHDPILDRPDQPTQLRVSLLRAKVARAAEMHGLRLDHLVSAVRTAKDILPPGELGQARRAELQTWLAELEQETHQVLRSEDEMALVSEVLGERSSGSGPRLLDWSKQARLRAQELWRALLGEAAWKRLLPASKRDLVTAEVTGHAAIDDLGRSAHLMALVLERELRERLWQPFWEQHPHKSMTVGDGKLKEDGPSLWGFDTLMARLTLEPELWSEGPDRAWLQAVRSAFRGIPTPTGRIRLKDLRNDIAHGNDKAPLTRSELDRVKAHLALSAARPLQRVTELPLHVTRQPAP